MIDLPFKLIVKSRLISTDDERLISSLSAISVTPVLIAFFKFHSAGLITVTPSVSLTPLAIYPPLSMIITELIPSSTIPLSSVPAFTSTLPFCTFSVFTITAPLSINVLSAVLAVIVLYVILPEIFTVELGQSISNSFLSLVSYTLIFDGAKLFPSILILSLILLKSTLYVSPATFELKVCSLLVANV